MSLDEAAIKDQLGKNPTTFPLLNANYSETVAVEEGPTRVSTNTLGEATIVGSSTNGIVGTNTGTVSGNQQVVGGSGRTETVERVVNPFNRFVEHFRDTEYVDTSNTTATIDTTTDYQAEFTAGQVLTSTTIFKNLVDINNITPTWESTGTLTFEVSLDGGSNWTEMTNNQTLNFSVTSVTNSFPLTFPITLAGTSGGQEIIYRFTESGGSTATVSTVTIKYNQNI